MTNLANNKHSMTRRSAYHDYTRSGIYHITLHVAEELGQALGIVSGNPSAPHGTPEAPRTVLTPIGQMVEHELLTSIHDHYPMVTVQDYVIMPEHMHFLLVVKESIISRSGKLQSLGQVIAGFKKGCNKRFWEMVPASADRGNADRGNNDRGNNDRGNNDRGNNDSGGETAAHTAPTAPAPAPVAPASAPASAPAPAPAPVFSGAGSVSGGFPAGTNAPGTNAPGTNAPGTNAPGTNAPASPSAPAYKVSSSAATGRQPLFGPGFCDVMPVNADQLATQRVYIANNPRVRLLRMSNRSTLTVCRGAIVTALTPSAMRKYLRRVCLPHQTTPDVLAAIESQLLIGSTPTIGSRIPAPSSTNPASSPVGSPTPFVACDSFGDRALLTGHRCLPVVCHRCDSSLFGKQKQRSLDAAARGNVLVSSRIAKGEQEIIDEAVNRGFPVIIIADNGFPPIYHPSAERIALCSEGRLLLVTPWQYQYRGKNEQVTVPFCKTMNCVAQALCRKKDSWWKE